MSNQPLDHPLDDRGPDGPHRPVDARADSKDQAARKLEFAQSIGGRWFSEGVFDSISGALLARELSRIELELFEADWRAATRRLHRKPTVDELGRTAAQRRADAVVEMALRSRCARAPTRPGSASRLSFGGGCQ